MPHLGQPPAPDGPVSPAVLSLLLAVVLATDTAAALWLDRRAAGRPLLRVQARLIGVMAAFMAVSGALRLGPPARWLVTLELLYVVLGVGMIVGYLATVRCWGHGGRRLGAGRGAPVLPLGVLAGLLGTGIAVERWGELWLGQPWFAVVVGTFALPAGGAMVVALRRRHRAAADGAAALWDQAPWLLGALLLPLKGLAWMLGEGTAWAAVALLVDPLLVGGWALAADRRVRVVLDVDTVGRDAVRALHESLLLVDVDETIAYGNPAAAALAGGALRGRPVRGLLPDWPPAGATTLVAQDGRRVPVVAGVAPLAVGGAPVGHAVSLTDVSALRAALDEAQEARSRATEAARAREEFLAVMSHEIRTPMNAVVGLSHLLAATPLDTEQAGWVGTIRESADALLVVISDILDFSRIQAGAVELESLPVDVDGVLTGALAVVQDLAAQRGLVLCRDGDGLPPRILGDPTRLRQIVLNLLSNAIKFTERGEVRLTAHHAAGELVVAVSDTGIGIPADRIAALFDAFTQADATTTRRFGGTGLGLAISRRLAEAMGGRLDAESTEGLGSTFTLRVPAPIALSGPAAAPPAAVPELGGLRVLIVEDNAINRRVLTAVLGRLGIEPDEASDGQEGVQRVLGQPYDVVFMDLQMPGMDGWEALSRITAARGPARPWLVSHSANVRAADAERARACGAHVHLPKPASPAAVAALLQRCPALVSGPDPAAP